MCLIAFAWNAHPRFPLILAANRDEAHERPSTAIAAWPEQPRVVGGRDLRAGGSWLAVARDGRLAAVTNVREPVLSTAPKTRGKLVHDFVAGHESAAAFSEVLNAEGQQYGPYNLLLWDGDAMVEAGNRPWSRASAVADGVHGVSNGAFNEPWPKVRRLTAALGEWLRSIDGEPDAEALFTALADRRPAPDEELPQTGVGIERERELSAPFIVGDLYGTRASTIVLVDTNRRIRMVERRFGPQGVALGESSIEIVNRP